MTTQDPCTISVPAATPTEEDFIETGVDEKGLTLTQFVTGKTILTGGFVESVTNQPTLMLVFTDNTTLVATCHDGDLVVGNGTAVTGEVH